MFKKPFKIKNNTQLKRSEIKSLRSEILKTFPELKDEDAFSIIPKKETVSGIKLMTHSNDLMTVYFSTSEPIAFEYENVLYPTVYLLWKYPHLLYCFTTWPQVFPKLASGADLMLPGIVLQDACNINSYGSLKKGDKVGINLTTNHAPIAVGITYNSSLDLFMSARKGKAVRVLHFFGDELWALGTKMSVPNLGPVSNAVYNDNSSDSKESSETISDLSSQYDQISLFTKPSMSESKISSPQTAAKAVNEMAVEDDISVESSSKSEKQYDGKQNMDEFLMYCFLKALRTTAKKAEFPMLVSTFCKQHLLAACPHGRSLDIKQTSYKKSSKFLAEMDSLGVIKIKEISKGVQKIISIDHSHPKLRDFVFLEEDSGESKSRTIKDTPKGRPEIKEMYIVTSAVLPFFRNFGYGKGTSLPLKVLRKHITDYVKEENLQNYADRRMVNLDAMLKKVINIVDDTQLLSWEELTTKIIGLMTHSYQCTLSDEASVISKGKLQPITINVVRRAGNKKVTLIDNLELYGLPIQEFARECQHGVAASISVNEVPGKKSQQLLVQGDQTIFVEKLLWTKYSIPKRYINILFKK